MKSINLKLIITLIFGVLLASEVLFFSFYSQGLALKLFVLAVAFLAYLLMFLGRYTFISFLGLFLANYAVLNVFSFFFQGQIASVIELIVLLGFALLWLVPLEWGEWSRWRVLRLAIILLAISQSEWILVIWFVDPLIKALMLILPVGLVTILKRDFPNPSINLFRVGLATIFLVGLLSLSLWQVSQPGLY